MIFETLLMELATGGILISGQDQGNLIPTLRPRS